MEFSAFRKKWTPQIDRFLADKLATEIADHDFGQIMAYSVMAGGKRLRPLLFLAVLETLGKEFDESALRTACGIELIHTYSLIHDDLPAMDNDDYRRGKLTSHKKWGEAQAILAGDALLPLGIEWIAKGSQNVEMTAVMAQAIGPNGMAGGQYLDIDATNNAAVKNDDDYLNRMEWLKTGCLILASVEMGAIYGQADAQAKPKLLDFAHAFGRAYQIYDDLVDVVESSEEAGKATHKDEAEGKNNTLTSLGVEASRKALQQLIDQAKADLTDFSDPVLAGFLEIYQKVL